MTSPQRVAQIARDAVRRGAPLSRLGVVAAAGASVTVRFEDGSSTAALSFATGLTLVPGDRVIAVPARGGEWVVMSKVSSVAVTPAYEALRVRPVHNWQKLTPANFTATYGPWWYQWDSPTVAGKRTLMFGQHPVQAGGAGVTQVDMENRANVLYYGQLGTLLPSGSTIATVSVVLQRIPRVGGVPLAPPVLWGHDHSPANPPVGNLDGTTPGGGKPPHWIAGYGPLVYPAIARGETTRITLPASWVTAWLAGTITGIGFYSDRSDQAITSYGPPDNADLEITYLPPPS